MDGREANRNGGNVNYLKSSLSRIEGDSGRCTATARHTTSRIVRTAQKSEHLGRFDEN